jgi:beta-lactamase regulating signal transducer with metallopeptidase domain
MQVGIAGLMVYQLFETKAVFASQKANEQVPKIMDSKSTTLVVSAVAKSSVRKTILKAGNSIVIVGGIVGIIASIVVLEKLKNLLYIYYCRFSRLSISS